LIHDDLPAWITRLRRGKNLPQKFGEAIAILAGDALLTLAFETVVVRRCCGARAAMLSGKQQPRAPSANGWWAGGGH
jgi:geranylgeranyl diphosphate synthase type II